MATKTEYVENVDEDHLSIPEVADYAKSFEISKLGKTYVVPYLGGDLVELKNDMDICNIALFIHDGDTIDIYVCHDTILEDVGPTEGQISQYLSQVGESLNAHGESDGSSSTFSSSEKVENNGVAGVQQETDDGYSSIYWTDTKEEVEPSVQQRTEPSIQEEVEPNAQENTEEDTDNDSICSDQSIDYESDVHEGLRIVKEDMRKFRESEVGLHEGYEDIEKSKKQFKDKLAEDEPYYDNSDCDSFQSDEEQPVSDDELEGESLRGRKKSNRVIYDSTCDVVLWQMCARHILENWSQNWRGIEKRKKFWACARATFEAHFKYNINALSKLEKGIVEDLIKYNKDKWFKPFFKLFQNVII
ncbi:hypothetical protein H5410_041804 [Solanum commersonii]|uniref:Uncharacterized protein n=1 Tax=Solanum commersonii TaxID=4109 RepID=A0A9J5XU63_SOLCO|nr:hypothetical protein H5410_041804 [Solanum commersonii]